ncbi:uncharacterized protein LOC132205733 [Neocloeon triangulifer]|uniref:uncharacterized protein LOC132205733 n=1 Tax=Neocloeon triangulifer TaxID=2078957 RepID=UPI00286F41D2|nr:uncharacterized protein LOC132205733 [Neocloeon triangulifer]
MSTGSTKTQYVAAAAATLGAMSLGSVLGWSSPAQIPVVAGDVYHFSVSPAEFSWVSSVVTLGAALSCMPAGFLVDWIGRKYTMLFISIPFVIGWAFIIWPAAVGMLIAGRLITGFCGGLFSVASPMYISEISDIKIRGLLSSFFQLMVVIGILFSYIIGAFAPIFWLSVACGLLPIVFAVCFFFMPETPQYLLRRNKDEEAAKALQWFRGSKCDIKNELDDMKDAVEEAKKNTISFFEMFRNRIAVKGILLLLGLFAMQQLSGINAVLFYANSIFLDAGSTLDPNINSIIIGAVQVAATIPASLVVDRLGRKLLLLISSTAMGIFIVILGFYFFFKDDLVDQGWLPVTTLVLYIIFFSFGAGPVVWVMAAEIFAPQVKGPASALGATFSWTLGFIVTLFYADLVAAVQNYTTFWIFGVCCFIGAAFILFFLPETKGKTNQQILRELVWRKRIMSSGSTKTQYVAAAAATLGAMSLGAVLGWSSPAQTPVLEGDVYNNFPVSPAEFSWVSSVVSLGAALSCMPAGFLVDWIGRKYTMLFMSIPFVIGWAFIIWPAAVGMLIAGRLITGFCGGLFCVASPMYIAEISDIKIRGLLSSFFQLMVVIGILFSYIIGAFAPIFWLSVACGLLPIVFAVCFFFMPETPQYLLRRNKDEEAAKALQWFRGSKCDIKNELDDMKDAVEEAKKNTISFIQMFRNRIAVKGILLLFGLFAMQQLSGINAVLFYANSIFVDAGSTLDPNINSIIIGAVQVAATIPASLVVDRLGRKLLLLVSSTAMGIFIIILGFYFFFKEDLVDQDWLPVTTLVLYIIFFSFGAGPVVWVVAAEIFAPQVKGPASALGATSNWTLAFLVTLFYADLVAAVQNYTTFWIFGVCCFLGAAFILFFLPETKGKTNQQILRELGAKD